MVRKHIVVKTELDPFPGWVIVFVELFLRPSSPNPVISETLYVQLRESEPTGILGFVDVLHIIIDVITSIGQGIIVD